MKLKSNNSPEEMIISTDKLENLTGKAANLTKQATKKAISATKYATKKLADFQIPTSITWVYSLGFKIGILLILKSFLILRYQFRNLSASGIVLITGQLIMAAIMLVGGVTMQTQSMYEDPSKLRRAANKYGLITLICSVVIVLKEWMHWDFFKIPNASNWFMEIWTTITKGAGEITLSLLFWDFDLWTLFCALLYVIADVYLYEMFDDPNSLFGWFFRKIKRNDIPLIETEKQIQQKRISPSEE